MMRAWAWPGLTGFPAARRRNARPTAGRRCGPAHAWRGGQPDDCASFVGCGAPAFELSSADWDYFTYTWHTQRDTYDKISFADLEHHATLVAMLAYLASEDPQFMPRARRTIYPSAAQNPRNAWLQPRCEPPGRRTPAWKQGKTGALWRAAAG